MSAASRNLLRAPELAVEAAERRAAITRYEARGIQAGGPVAVALREQQPHQRLQTGDEQGTRLEPIPVIQPCNLAQLHTVLDALLPWLATRHYGPSRRCCLTFPSQRKARRMG